MKKEKIYIKPEHRAVVHGFLTGDFEPSERIHERNKEIYMDAYKKLQYGLIEYFYVESGCVLYAFTKDTVYDGVVRVTTLIRYGSGDDAYFVPSSHRRFGTVAEFLRYGLPTGCYLFIVNGWYDEMKNNYKIA